MKTGRVRPALAADGTTVLANYAQASRRIACRNAVVAARKAVDEWLGAECVLRGQILLPGGGGAGMRAGGAAELISSTGAKPGDAEDEVTAAVDLLVHYAGSTDDPGRCLRP